MSVPLDAPRRRARRRSSAPLAVLFAVATAVAGATGVIMAADETTANVERVEGLEDILAPKDGPAQNFLLVGSDTRATADPGSVDFGGIGDTSVVQGQRSDTIMILRQEEDGNGAALVSIPRDLWVEIAGDSGENRINAAYNEGADVLAATITNELGIPIHHYVEVDFEGFKSLIDALGGVELCFYFASRDKNTGLWQDPGCHVVDGVQALAFARSRYFEEFRDGDWQRDGTADLGRIGRQQRFIRTTADTTLAKLQSDPFLASDLIDAAAGAMRVDAGLDVLDAAGTLRKAFASGLSTYQLPVSGVERNGNAVLVLDDGADPILDYFRGTGPLPPPQD
jgi:LCP family protein required for cell wall assembly